jgi:hypothetical protein
MYRAPAKKMPPMYGGLVGWHRHQVTATWMTHVWITNTTRSAVAQCAPFEALHARNAQISYGPYRADVPMIDEPCPDTAGYTPPQSSTSG